MAPGYGEDLAPERTGFESAWRGFNRAQVSEFVERAEREIARLTAERDAAARRAAVLSAENRELKAKIDRISRIPIEPDALQERSRRMIELTREEAAEITARANEYAERTRREAQAEAVRLTERERALVAEAEIERKRKRAEEEELARQAEARRRELDQAAARRRAQLEEDLTQALAAKREATMRELAKLDEDARAKADRLVAEASACARKLVTEAELEVAVLNDLRDRLAASMRGLRGLLAEAGAVLEPAPGDPSVPEPRRSRTGQLSDVG
jgi:cell division septum initiation protein DivIVA